MKVGLFFGTFNPVHNGHYNIALYILNQKYVDQVWVILTPLSPFKKKERIAHFDHRMDMLKIAFKNHDNVLISDIERNFKKPNYTINTLSYLRELYPKNEFSIILGADNFQKIHLWKNYETILKNHPIFIYPRKGFNLEKDFLHIFSKKIQTLSTETFPVSSSLIRENFTDNKYASYLNSNVYKYIIKNKLY